ncbi:MAG: alpha/beta hydrolase, partial [Panacagrimonas sp.]
YLLHRFFLRDGELLEGLDALRDIPVEIVQGALDPVCPPISAWELAGRLPHARLHRVPLAGHGAFEAALSGALVETMDGLRSRLR